MQIAINEMKRVIDAMWLKVADLSVRLASRIAVPIDQSRTSERTGGSHRSLAKLDIPFDKCAGAFVQLLHVFNAVSNSICVSDIDYFG